MSKFSYFPLVIDAKEVATLFIHQILQTRGQRPSLNYSQILLRPRWPLFPQQIFHQAPVSIATGAILEIRYSQSDGAIITMVYE